MVHALSFLYFLILFGIAFAAIISVLIDNQSLIFQALGLWNSPVTPLHKRPVRRVRNISVIRLRTAVPDLRSVAA